MSIMASEIYIRERETSSVLLIRLCLVGGRNSGGGYRLHK